jgi:hypothetical protein
MHRFKSLVVTLFGKRVVISGNEAGNIIFELRKVRLGYLLI